MIYGRAKLKQHREARGLYDFAGDAPVDCPREFGNNVCEGLVIHSLKLPKSGGE